MAPRYIALPASKSWAADEWYDGGRTSIDVTDNDHRPQWSGLFDAYGTRLYRVPERVVVGFHGSKGLRT
jgi:hypothetical protein